MGNKNGGLAKIRGTNMNGEWRNADNILIFLIFMLEIEEIKPLW